MRRGGTPTRRSASTVVALAVAGAGLAVAPVAPATAAGRGVCEGVSGCRVVARVDVNGDGRRDAVGIARRGSSSAGNGAVVVRVRTGTYRIVAARRPLDYWYGSPWHGAASLDGRRGKELVVGHVAGAHTQFFWVLTMRAGRLVTLRAPGGAPDWVVDGAYNVSRGWLRGADQRVGTVVRRTADRNGTSRTFHAVATTFRWTSGGWQRVRRTVHPRLAERTAYAWGGWRVRGLPRW